MSHDYSENILIQESVGHLLERELDWEAILLNSWLKTVHWAGKATRKFCKILGPDKPMTFCHQIDALRFEV